MMENVMTIMVRKASDKNQIIYDTKVLLSRCITKPKEVVIEHIVELTKEEFECFENNLLKDRNYIEKYKVLNNKNGVILIKEEGTKDEAGILVDPQGYNYARYTGIIMKECDILKCPKCNRYYIDPPAISRDDNKTLICTECGIEEALISYKNYKQRVDEMNKFIDELKTKAKDLGVKIDLYPNINDGEEKISINP